jgi:hypothetical protein
VLRRRRQVRNAVGGGVVVVAAVAAGLALRGMPAADVEMDPAGPGMTDTGALPAVTLDPDEWTVISAGEHPEATEESASDEIWADASFQVFRAHDEQAGPTAAVYHKVASDPVVAEPLDREVDVDGDTGFLRQTADESFTLRWNPDHGDTQALLNSWGLTQDQVVEFAGGLQPREDGISYPATDATQLGFVATQLPVPLDEVLLVTPLGQPQPGVRQVMLRSGKRTAEVMIDRGGEEAYELKRAALLATAGEVRVTRVLDRLALLIEQPDGQWSLIWRHTPSTMITVTLAGVGRADIDDIAGRVEELTADQWSDLVADHS